MRRELQSPLLHEQRQRLVHTHGPLTRAPTLSLVSAIVLAVHLEYPFHAHSDDTPPTFELLYYHVRDGLRPFVPNTGNLNGMEGRLRFPVDPSLQTDLYELLYSPRINRSDLPLPLTVPSTPRQTTNHWYLWLWVCDLCPDSGSFCYSITIGGKTRTLSHRSVATSYDLLYAAAMCCSSLPPLITDAAGAGCVSSGYHRLVSVSMRYRS